MKTTGRSVPSVLARVVQELELRQPKLVTRELLADVLAREGLHLTVDDAADRLRRHGWLLSLRTRGAWEFAPGARAGAFGSGDPYIEFRATLHRRPGFPITLAYDSAVWLHGLARRAPERDIISVPRGVPVPPALKGFRVTHLVGRLSRLELDGLPVWRLESLLVLMAQRPNSYRAWPNVLEWLPELRGKLDEDALLEELRNRPSATWARTGYLVERARLESLTDIIDSRRPRSKGPVYLGPRSKKGVYDNRWDVIDSLLTTRFGSPRET